VRELLEALSSDDRYYPSLLTGNVEKLAEAKLKLAGLWDYFPVRGAFGKWCHREEHDRGVAGVGECGPIQSGEARRVLDARNREQILDGPLHHRVGARERRARGQLHDRYEVALVLRRDEAAGRAPDLPCRRGRNSSVLPSRPARPARVRRPGKRAGGCRPDDQSLSIRLLAKIFRAR